MSVNIPAGDSHIPRVCDYEGSPYRRVFWEEADRSFEDAAERLALRALLPPSGHRLLDLGAGFGRLAGEYDGYEDVVLLDYAHSMLTDARSRLGDGFTYVCADLYNLPFAAQSFDAVVQVRVLHHVEDVPRAFGQIAHVLATGGSYILEFANKRNLKAVARHALGSTSEDPFDEQPYEFVPLNWNFHPIYIDHLLADAGLTVRQRRAVSHFRLPALKRLASPQLLARTDALLGGPLAKLALAPSQFVRAARLVGAPSSKVAGAAIGSAMWRCPACGTEPLAGDAHGVQCTVCGRYWGCEDGVYLFREGA